MSSEQYFHQSQWESFGITCPGSGRVDATIGSALDIFGGKLLYDDVPTLEMDGNGPWWPWKLQKRWDSSSFIQHEHCWFSQKGWSPHIFFRDTHISGKPSWLWDDHSPWIPCSAHGTCEQWQKSLMKYQCCYMGLYNLVYWGLLYVVVLAHTRENMGYIWANWHNGI